MCERSYDMFSLTNSLEREKSLPAMTVAIKNENHVCTNYQHPFGMNIVRSYGWKRTEQPRSPRLVYIITKRKKHFCVIK